MVCYATPLIGGPRKTFANRCNDNSPRETRRTIMQSLSAIENFLGFQSTREHNASILPKCLDESLGSSLQRYCKARENTNLFAVFRAAAYLHLAEQDKCSASFNTLQQIPNKKETPLSDVPISIKEEYVNSHPNTMLASICSLRLISRPIFKVGSLFPERYSLTREGLIPSSWARPLCVMPISYIRNLITSISDGEPIAKCSSE